MTISHAAILAVAKGARDKSQVSGYTHNFYRYPARFSPAFAAGAIEAFTEPGDLICEPYMGGGTAVVQGLAMGRDVVGNDLNSLAHFVTKVKVTPLTRSEIRAITSWAEDIVPTLTYSQADWDVEAHLGAPETHNLHLDRGRFIKRVIAAGLASLGELPTRDAQDFVRCVLLRVSQWALDGRKTHTSLTAFRDRLSTQTIDMLAAMDLFSNALDTHEKRPRSYLRNGDAGDIDCMRVFSHQGRRARLCVTSPPYPGVHMLYHRWQVDGRRETPAPYWIAGRKDGEGSSFYNFGDRRASGIETYFANSLRTLTSIRGTLADDGVLVQLIAFNNPRTQLRQYLATMEEAGFKEFTGGRKRIWRRVPNRRWHATQQQRDHSSNEVVLVHIPA